MSKSRSSKLDANRTLGLQVRSAMAGILEEDRQARNQATPGHRVLTELFPDVRGLMHIAGFHESHFLSSTQHLAQDQPLIRQKWHTLLVLAGTKLLREPKINNIHIITMPSYHKVRQTSSANIHTHPNKQVRRLYIAMNVVLGVNVLEVIQLDCI